VVPLDTGDAVEGRLGAVGLAAGVLEEGSVAIADAVDSGGDEANVESVSEIEDPKVPSHCSHRPKWATMSSLWSSWLGKIGIGLQSGC
jgi:hypothetical protein